MARQGVITTKKTVTIRIGINKSNTDTKASLDKRVVNVPAHVRMVHGKPVFVAGYSYHR